MSNTLTREEAAELMKASPDTVSDCIKNRGLPAAKVGRGYVLIEDDVRAWLRTQYSTGDKRCESINAGSVGHTGSISAKREAAALAAALAPRTNDKRVRRQPVLRAICGGSAA